ncbi:MAG: hypothetical protein AB9903_08380 [Vulcanimicrobiota bacterium]
MNLRLPLIFILVLMLCIPGITPAFPREEEPDTEASRLNSLSYCFSLGYASRYMWRGLDLNDGYPIMQPNIELILGESGHSFGLFGFYGLQGTRQYDEIDYIWKYEHPIGNHWSYTLNLAWYDVFFGDRYCEAYGTISWDDCQFHPVLSYYKEIRFQGTDYFNLSISHDIKFCKIPFCLSCAQGYGQGPLMENPGFSDMEIALSTDWCSNDRFSLNLKVAYNLTPSDPTLPTNNIIWYSVMTKYTF